MLDSEEVSSDLPDEEVFVVEAKEWELYFDGSSISTARAKAYACLSLTELLLYTLRSVLAIAYSSGLPLDLPLPFLVFRLASVTSRSQAVDSRALQTSWRITSCSR